MNFKPQDHHATLTACRECERLKLNARMAKTDREKAQWTRLLDKHLRATSPAVPGKVGR